MNNQNWILGKWQKAEHILSEQLFYIYVPPGMTGWGIMFPGCPSVRPSVTLYGHHFVCSTQQMLATDYHVCIDVHLLLCFDIDLYLTSFQGYVWHGFSSSIFTEHPVKANKSLTNYHAYIAMPIWFWCVPPILLWHWPPFNLPPRSCITLDFLHQSSLRGITLCAAPCKSHDFSTNYQRLTYNFYINLHWWAIALCACPAKADTLRALEQLRSQPNDTLYPPNL